MRSWNCFIYKTSLFSGPVYFAEDSADGDFQAGGVSAERRRRKRQRSEFGSQRSEDGKTEVRSQMSEVRGQKSGKE